MNENEIVNKLDGKLTESYRVTRLSLDEYLRGGKRKRLYYAFDVVLELPNKEINFGCDLRMILLQKVIEKHPSLEVEVITEYQETVINSSTKISGVVFTRKNSRKVRYPQ